MKKDEKVKEVKKAGSSTTGNGTGAKKRKRRVAENEADWSSVDAGILADLITNVTRDDGAVRFGYSRDGGAYSIGIYGDGKPYNEYRGADDDVDDWLAGIRDDFAD